MKQITLFSFLLLTFFSFSQTLTIEIPKNRFQIDTSKTLIISQIDSISTFKDLNRYKNININFNHSKFSFNLSPNTFSYDTSYILTKNSKAYTLYFTSLPLISFN